MRLLYLLDKTRLEREQAAADSNPVAVRRF
jgi:hypothetical protein